MILMIEKLKEFFDGELEIEEIRKMSDTFNMYEIDTKGFPTMRCGYILPMGTFRHMFEFGMNNFQIINPKKGKLVGLWEMEYKVTIRFKIENEELFLDMMGE